VERYIGLDVHAASTTIAVVGPSGKVLRTEVVETYGQALIEALGRITGKLHVCLEEGTQSAWLCEILSPRVEELVVTTVAEGRGPLGQKNDAAAHREGQAGVHDPRLVHLGLPARAPPRRRGSGSGQAHLPGLDASPEPADAFDGIDPPLLD
jgi:hypothetical protein